ncbi:MAG: bifunctional 5,10-methylene-tetrahydrofolate dehydrogenase/5,10-methylene-tetrahydrofolate cyclohydrolase [Parcubacteria group bacterium CG_4_9_14_0_2_um_filter_41_8]|nr:MAG: hypothetical protein AUJ34_02690 [Parcubacteria group bacterium CG1_02_41_12]PIP67002.1 MAG: bifunctional 5,10-methylene-tetrahydrofolate dehydrogenase/5,10-methylene-tetrahydrofolate cyclohydrolase [Parcubacteria group bacterium CG22_combo_CG10-13_8_21_14_all_41_9]PIQ80448.1 MAG: bifunctional 5,10-methylene-tetrahydrofolate dehydrogenase/5,10-methylene-tetrahydrofolate cyclohydrolase [Parcubacteria group bacterium CG11_big_fil_rev_8_21_14_0_20_41_14]PJC40692.1 MAG: bifunctional 5,10-met
MNKAKIINGKKIADQIRQEVADQVAKLNIQPCLAVLLIGNDPASHLYVSIKKKAAEQCGIQICLYNFDEIADEDEILETISFLNKDEEVDAILVQLPLPEKFDEDAIISAIDPKKDVDGFHPENIKKILSSKAEIFSPLNMGILQLLTATGENLQDKTAIIIARSKEFTQTLTHVLEDFGVKTIIINPYNQKDDAALSLPAAGSLSRQATSPLKANPPLGLTFNSDIIISAVGKPNWIHANNIKQGSILIDVGTARVQDKTLGDFDFDSCAKKASWITPVPGGVGPMTVAMLLKNTLLLARKNGK